MAGPICQNLDKFTGTDYWTLRYFASAFASTCTCLGASPSAEASPDEEIDVSLNWSEVAVGFGACLALSLICRRWVGPLGWMDCPDSSRKVHRRPTPRTAGLVLWALLIFLQVSGRFPVHLDLPDWIGIHVMAGIGLLDDRFNLRARYKAAAGLGVAILLAAHVTHSLGGRVPEVGFLGMELPTHAMVIFPFLMLWFWALPQAYNLIDGINGLSLGFAALLLGVLGANLGVQSGLLWGGLAAVLALNFPWARHFMGDCGSLMMGTLFAILGVEAFAIANPNLLLWVFAYPIIDVSLVVTIRRWKKRPLSKADRSHMHHWLMDRFEHRSWVVTPLLLSLAALPMLRATRVPGHSVLSILGLGLLLLLALKVLKHRVSAKGMEEDAAQVRREVPILVKGAREASGAHYRF